jgi:hypothetical protein
MRIDGKKYYQMPPLKNRKPMANEFDGEFPSLLPDNTAIHIETSRQHLIEQKDDMSSTVKLFLVFCIVL